MGTNVKGAEPIPHPNWSQDEVWSWIQNKINRGDYLALINWLQSDTSIQNKGIPKGLIGQAALDLCQICQRHQEETEASWETFQRAVTQEKALGSNLTTLFNALLLDSSSHPAAITLPHEQTQRPLSLVTSPAANLAPLGIWQRVQNFFNPPQTAPMHTNPAPMVWESTPSPTPAIVEEHEKTASQPEPEKIKEPVPSLTIYMLGSFRVYQDDRPILDWANGKSAALFKYLLARRQEKIAKEVLMDTFWPDAAPDAARNNLNVTIYNLRRILRDGYQEFSHILFKDHYYLLNPAMSIWIDAEAFEQNIRSAQEHEGNGRSDLSIQNYHAAEALYQGDYLSEDRYEDWPMPYRQTLQDLYIHTLNKLSSHYFNKDELTISISLCRQILAVDSCREETHRQLMLSYYQLGQPHLAVRQFHQLTECLQEELNTEPSQDTIQLLNQIQHQQIPADVLSNLGL